MERIQDYNQRGLFPGPLETEEDFLKRAAYCISLKEILKQHMGKEFPFEMADSEHFQGFEEGLNKTRLLFDVYPDWVPLIFSNYQLLPWHGGCAWIFQLKETDPTAAFLQLRCGFLKKKRLFGFYRADDIIAHELTHAARMLFQEPKFEEILAGRTASSSWKRWTSSLLQAPWEGIVFVMTVLLIFLLDLANVFTGGGRYLATLAWLKLIPVFMVIAALARSYVRQEQLKKCLINLEKVMPKSEQALWVAFRLTDAEIIRIGSISPEAFLAELPRLADASLRWKIIKDAYFG